MRILTGLSFLCYAVVLIALGLLGLRNHASVPETSPESSLLSDVGPSESEGQDLARALEGLEFEDGRVRPASRTSWPEHPEAARELVEEGRRQLRAGRRIMAVAPLARAVMAAPSQAESYDGLGRALRTLGRTDEALAAFRTALDLDRGRTETLAEVARTLEFQGRYEEAATAWQDLAERPETESSLAGTAHERLAILRASGRTDVSPPPPW